MMVWFMLIFENIVEVFECLGEFFDCVVYMFYMVSFVDVMFEIQEIDEYFVLFMVVYQDVIMFDSVLYWCVECVYEQWDVMGFDLEQCYFVECYYWEMIYVGVGFDDDVKVVLIVLNQKLLVFMNMFECNLLNDINDFVVVFDFFVEFDGLSQGEFLVVVCVVQDCGFDG